MTVYEPVAAGRDHPTLPDQTQRTVFDGQTTKAEIIAAALELLPVRAEVTIWRQGKSSGRLVEGWVPPGTLMLAQPGQILVQSGQLSDSDRSRRIDRYSYDYAGSDGRLHRIVFEVELNAKPAIPRRGSKTAIAALKIQWIKELPPRVPITVEAGVSDSWLKK